MLTFVCRADNGKSYSYLRIEQGNSVYVNMTWRMPQGISCDNGCMFQ
jgi:hypothetical protein